MLKLRPFQRRFIRGALAPGIDTACLSAPRGNGKSALAATLLTRFLTPGDPLHSPGKEAVLLSGSIEQARIVFNFCRADLEPSDEYRYVDSATRCGIVHKPTNTRLRVHGSNSKTAFGLVNTPFVCWDEPGAAEVVGGQQLWDAIATAMGKPGSPLKAILIGTIAPSMGGWWREMIETGSTGSIYVQSLQGDPKRWDKWPEIRRCNPLTAISKSFRKKLLAERDAARADSRLRARFLSYRLNVPAGDESEMLLSIADFEAMCSRPVPDREGPAIVGIDMGAGRAWSAAVAVFENGRIEARALCPGVPSIEDQERRDRQPAGTYQRLVDSGVLAVADGLRVPPAALLLAMVRAAWGDPAAIVCDRFRLPDLEDTDPDCPIEPRVPRWSESSEDIRALRSGALDGPFSCAPDSVGILAASLAVAVSKTDESGNVRLIKKGSNNTSRDDVAAALVLAAGAYSRDRAAAKRDEKPKVTIVG